MNSIKVCEYSRSRSFHDDLILQDQASGERSQDHWSSGLCLYRPVCVRPVRKPHCWFSHEAAHILHIIVPRRTPVSLRRRKTQISILEMADFKAEV